MVFFDSFLVALLFFVTLLVEAGLPIPIPHDVLILISGHERLPILQVILAVVMGNIIGSSILYLITLKFGASLLSKFGIRFGLTTSRVQRVERWISQYGGRALIIARILPGFRFAATVASGTFRLPYLKVFLPFLALGSVVWVTLYYWAGRFFRITYGTALLLFGMWRTVDVMIASSIMLVGIWLFLRSRSNKNAKT